MAKVAVDLRPLWSAAANRGGGSYLRSLLDGYARLGPEHDFVWLVPAGAEGRLPPAALSLGGTTVAAPTGPARIFDLVDPIRLAAVLDRCRADLYHSAYLSLPLRHRCPVIATLHDLTPLVLWRQFPKSCLRLSLQYALLGSVDLVLADSNATAEDAALRLGIDRHRLEVISLASGRDFFPVARRAALERVRSLGVEVPYVLAHGLDDPNKSLPDLLQAVSMAAAQIPDLHLVMVGAAGPRRRRMASMAERLLGPGRCLWLGWVPSDSLACLYSACTVYLSASRHEGFGLPLLEAMACGAPVLCVRGGASAETCGPAGEVVEADAGSSLAAALVRLWQDSERRQRMGLQGLEWACGFSIEKTAERTLRAYDRVLAKGIG